MNKTQAKIISLAISLIVTAIYWYVTLPAFNLADFYFLGGVVLSSSYSYKNNILYSWLFCSDSNYYYVKV